MADRLQQDWTEIQVSVPAEKIETAGNIANMTVPYGIYIEDYSDVDGCGCDPIFASLLFG